MEHVEVLRELRDTGDVSDWRAMESALDAAIAALSQQPAALHTCSNCEGVSPESCLFNRQPAAVDGALVERLAQAVATELYGEPPPPGNNSLTRAMMLPGIKSALTAALAAQPGVSDNDR